ncbi:alkaline phosphatase D family protein [Qingshengfaniella alkalisoli]|uniref:Alkaline phosphatase family protein n=1 Tax=Qingshengfaniella alkalisoli TaxID=2599296 RepID=A0A5B8IBB0_9RHOB|nr:alkaline phosphatase D family protein [Qingshengfaniella alkalisoli]QDY70696.1 alkaline phosphatase family protein [Qingshengfaniella alkalisoli]
MPCQLSLPIGPILILDDIRDGHAHLAALFIAPKGQNISPVEIEGRSVPTEALAEFETATAHRCRFSVPIDRASEYVWDGHSYPLSLDLLGNLRLAYVSCNGEEVGDLDREGSERNAMWARLREEHCRQPFAFLLHGGDQVYADEVTRDHDLSEHWPERVPSNPSADALADLRLHLRERFLERYAALYASPEFAWLAARVPSLMQWDDHDICDGWGSLPETQTESAVGQTLFSVARECFLIFQHAALDGDLPLRFADPSGIHLGWSVKGSDLSIIAPDLRSERTRHRIMGQGGWAMMDAEAAGPAQGHTFLMSSVPLLGPRLSLLEALMIAVPQMQKYEDDLRDQWQSRAHRTEWRRILRLVQDMALRDGHDLTAISGEIHLATRAVMELGQGLQLQQLVASGIAHRAPPTAWARTLGALSWLGEAPLPGHPIRIERLPGQSSRYVAERNYLLLERHSGAWSARWDLEQSGMTAPLALSQ